MIMEWWAVIAFLFIPILGFILIFVWTDINLQKVEDDAKKDFNYSLQKTHDLISEMAEQQDTISCLKKDIKNLKDNYKS